MENEKFRDLADRWYAATDTVLAFQECDRKELGNLFFETYTLIKEYSRGDTIPRELYRVFRDMNDFSWWVMCSEGSPTAVYFHEIINLVSNFNFFLLNGIIDELEVQYDIESIKGEL